MCGRFALYHEGDEIAERFQLDRAAVELEPRYNIAPTQPVAVVVQTEERLLDAYRWGLVPSWARDPAIGNRMINARGETLAEKPAYKAAFRRRRCLIPASGFYEWRKDGKAKIPTFIRCRDGAPLALAGMWEEWRGGDSEPLRTCTIVTTAASDFMRPIHDRMPVILNGDGQRAWLDPGQQDADALSALLRPWAADDLLAHPVSGRVNSPGHDAPDCIAPAG